MTGLAVKPGVLNQIQSCLVVCEISHLKSIVFYSLPFMYLMFKYFNFLDDNDKDDDEVWNYS